MNKLYIFDLDGVLEVEEQVIEARKQALYSKISDKLGISIDEAKNKLEKAAETLPKKQKNTTIYRFMSLGFNRDDYSKVLNSVNPLGIISAHEGAKEVLSELSINNKVVVYSNAPQETADNTLKILELDSYIDKVYSSDSFKESKPSIENLKIIMRDQRFDSSNTIMIGNSLDKDIAPALELGIKGILFDPENKFSDKKSIKSLKEIINLDNF